MNDRTEVAEDLYADYLAQGGSAQGDFEEFCRRHEDHSDQLRRVHEGWNQVSGVYTALLKRRDVGLSLKRRFGKDIDPALSLERPPADDSVARRVVKRLEAHAPKQSRYRILDEVARGGMGAILRVWDPDLRRSLAMKIALRDESETDTKSTPEEERSLSRFLEEAQVTGQLDHPGIVPVHELGVDADGRVYFTMRLVRGRELEKIIGLAQRGEESWTITRALGVVLRVCETMAFAHDKGVIHRDLKPSNIMVGRFGEVYVMDWGLARVQGREDRNDARLRPKTATMVVHTDREEVRGSATGSELMTMDGEVMGTPAYMSPEQAHGTVEALDQRSDIYSVGAILYHLLSGHLPYCPTGSEHSGYAVWDRVRAGSPESLHDEAPEASPELVAITEKAMARAPEDRYASMQELANDLHSYVEGRVVKAYETGSFAEFRKWVRRNRGTAASSAAALFLALGGLGGVSYVEAQANTRLEAKNTLLAEATATSKQARDEAVQAKRQAERAAVEARRERDAKGRLVDFLVGLFESPDPSLARGEKVTAKELLDRGSRSIAWELDEDPLVRADFMEAMGLAYHSLGLYPDAEPLLASMLEGRRKQQGQESPDTLRSMNELAILYRSQGRYEDAEDILTEALEAERRVLGEEAPATSRTVNDLAVLKLKQGDFERSEELHKQALAVQERALEPDHADTLKTRNALALLYREQARYDDAERLFREALDGRRRTLGDDHPETLGSLNDLAGVMLLKKEFDQAQELFEQSLQGRRRVLGDDHPNTLLSLNDLAYLHLLRRRYSEAEPLYLKALEGFRELLGDDHPNTLTILNNLGGLYFSQGRYEDAEPLFVSAMEASLRVRGNDHPNTVGALNSLGSLYYSQRRYDEAKPLFQEALEIQRRLVNEDHPNTLQLIENLARLHHSQGDEEEAEILALELVENTPREDPLWEKRALLLDNIQTSLD